MWSTYNFKFFYRGLKVYENLKNAMKKQGITGYQLFHLANINHSDFYNAINGKKPFYKAWRKRISEVLKIKESELFTPDQPVSRDNK